VRAIIVTNQASNGTKFDLIGDHATIKQVIHFDLQQLDAKFA
jgi:hypothetical protein